MNKHRNMILNPDDWPVWPRLPLKRPNKVWFDPAFMLAHDQFMPLNGDGTADPNKPFTIHLGLMYESVDELTPTKTYPNVDALLADGWVVD